MIVTRTYEITFDEPNPGWLCSDNLSLVLHSHCKNTKFEVREIDTSLDSILGL